MSKNTETAPGDLNSRPLIASIDEAILELRRLLAIPPKERSEDWQNSVSPMIGFIAGDFSKQENSEIALVDITLIAFAAQKGSKDAKKWVLKPTRWISIPPPSISDVFSEIEEARCAIRVLQPIKGDWTVQFIVCELAKNKWPALSASLVDWLLSAATTVEALLVALGKAMPNSFAENSEWISVAIENATKLLSKSHIPAGTALMAEAAVFSKLLVSRLNGNINPDASVQLHRTENAFLALISQVSSVEPSILIQGAVVPAIASICPLSGLKKGNAPQELENLCKRTISLLAVLIPGADQSQLAHYRKIWNVYRERLPTKANQMLRSWTREFPALDLLESTRDQQAGTGDLGITAGMESIFCELIVNWDEYFALHSTDPAAQQISSRIEELSLQLGVTRFGEVGELVAYDPVKHHLPENVPTPPEKVTVIKPGIALERTDRTSRVLLMAVVNPHSTT